MRPSVRPLYMLGGLFLVVVGTALFAAQHFRPTGPTLIVTSNADNGPGTLRQAVIDAQDGDTIQFDPALNGQTILLTTGQLVINKNITINGPGPNLLALSAIFIPKFLFRVLHVTPAHIVTIAGLTIRDGNANGTGGGGGIFNDHATLTINNCTITSNHSDSQGAGIYNDGSDSNASLMISNSHISGNSCFSSQNPVVGGGIASTGNAVLTITDSVVDGNVAEFDPQQDFPEGDGGGIYNNGANAALTIINSTVNNNRVGQDTHPSRGNGGGIWSSGTATIMDTTLEQNRAGWGGGISNSGICILTGGRVNNNTSNGWSGSTFFGSGGGIYNHDAGTLTVTNATLSGNSAPIGGALSGNAIVINNCTISSNQVISDGAGISGSATVTNTTISGNSAGFGAGISGGGIIDHTTIANNTASGGVGVSIVAITSLEIGNTVLKTGSAGSNIHSGGGKITSHGFNISNDNGGGYLIGPGDQTNTDPMLGPLQDNGGPTFTHALLPNSSAINAGNPNFTPPPDFDQRGPGYLRVSAGRIDIGSFEVQFQPTPSPTVSPTCPPIITQSTSLTITPLNSVSCNNGTGHTDNSYWRAFNMLTFTGGAELIVTSVSFGVESANNTQPVTLRLYANNGGAFPAGTRTQIGINTVNVTPAQSGTVVTIPLIATVAAGTGELVMELFTPDGQAAGNLFFVGSNTAPQTGPSYLSAAACGVTTPTDVAALGFPNMHIVFNVLTGCPDHPTPTATATATFTATVPPTSTPTPTDCNPPFCTATPTLTASPTATATVTATATASPSPSSTPCGVFFSENFDDLPVGTPGSCAYISNVDPDTPPNDLFFEDQDGINDCVYDLQGVTIPNNASVFRFRNNFNSEFSNGIYWDGGVLEVSAPAISNGDFLDITDSHVGGTFIAGGYTGEIDGTANNPLAGRFAWSGDSHGYIDTIINLGPNLAGQTVTFRFRFGSDEAVGAPGWRIDTIFATDGNCPTPTPSTTPTPSPARSLNLSTRLRVGTGNNIGIGGVIIGGVNQKQILVRGIGPSLTPFGVPDALADTTLELRDANTALILRNDNWRDTQETEIQATGIPPTNDLESALIATVQPGAYTALLAGKNEAQGVGLVEVYDLTASGSQLRNISTRAFAGTAFDVVIAGFILGQGANTNIVVRGLGPSLVAVGVPEPLPDPTLELHDGNGALLVMNDNWQDDPISAGQLTANGLAPKDALESGIFISVSPGPYTATLAGKNGGTGLALVEIYNLQ